MPYPLCRSDDRLCRALFYRNVQRVQDFWDHGGKCLRCHKRMCFNFACAPRVTDQPKETIWDEFIQPKRIQGGYFHRSEHVQNFSNRAHK